MIGRSLGWLAVISLVGGSGMALLPSGGAEVRATSVRPVGQRRSRPLQADWLRSLNLTPEQVQQIQAIRKRYQARLTAERQAVRVAQQELNQLMTGNASPEQIRQQFEQLQGLKQKLGDTRLESMLAIRNVLNPDQRQKLTEIIRQMGQNRDRSPRSGE